MYFSLVRMMKISIEFYFYCTTSQSLGFVLVKTIASISVRVGQTSGGNNLELLQESFSVTTYRALGTCFNMKISAYFRNNLALCDFV
jgi:hypothetical protein